MRDKNVDINDKVNMKVHLQNTGEITFSYDVPESWDNNKYAIVQLCDFLNDSIHKQLVGCEVAVSPDDNVDIRSTPFDKPAYSIDADISQNDDNIYSLVLISYLNGNIPNDRDTNKDLEHTPNVPLQAFFVWNSNICVNVFRSNYFIRSIRRT